jgi:hypothetical protein
MEASDINHRTITEFLTRLVTHSYGIFSLDEKCYVMQGEEYISINDTEKIPTAHKLILYQESFKDATNDYILNPFSESLTSGIVQSWFYDLLISCNECSIPIIRIMKNMLKFSVYAQDEITNEEQKEIVKSTLQAKKKKLNKHDYEEQLVAEQSVNGLGFILNDIEKIRLSEFLAPFSIDITTEVLDQFDLITAVPTSFFKIIYKDDTKKALVSSNMFNSTERNNYRSIKPKTWKLYQDLFKKIFHIEDITDLSVTSNSLSYPRLDSCFTLFLNVQQVLNEFLYLLLDNDNDKDLFKDNLDFFQEIVEHFPKMKRLGSWLKGIPAMPLVKPNVFNTKPMVSLTSPIQSMNHGSPYKPNPFTQHSSYNFNKSNPINYNSNMVGPLPTLHFK